MHECFFNTFSFAEVKSCTVRQFKKKVLKHIVVILYGLMIKIKRVYEKIDVRDGERVLVDRMWPRGIRRSTSHIDIWVKNIGPSTELRKWYSHDPKKWARFRSRYIAELKQNRTMNKLMQIVMNADPVTFVYSSKDTRRNNAVVLAGIVNRLLARQQKQQTDR